MSNCLCGCGRDLPESKGRPRKFFSDQCRMRYKRYRENEQKALEKTNEFAEKANKIENEQGETNKPEKANKVELSKEQTRKLLLEKKRAVWSDVLANPDQKYCDAVIEYCGGAPNALYAADARSFVEAEKKVCRWDPEKRYEFREGIF